MIVVVVVLANAWLGYLTWHQFGWRMHSRFGCDLRRKLATERLELFFLTNRFRWVKRHLGVVARRAPARLAASAAG